MSDFRLSISIIDHDPKSDEGETLEETPLEMVRHVVWTVLYANDARVISRSPGGLARIMAVVVLACQEFLSMVSESNMKIKDSTARPRGRPTV